MPKKDYRGNAQLKKKSGQISLSSIPPIASSMSKKESDNATFLKASSSESEADTDFKTETELSSESESESETDDKIEAQKKRNLNTEFRRSETDTESETETDSSSDVDSAYNAKNQLFNSENSETETEVETDFNNTEAENEEETENEEDTETEADIETESEDQTETTTETENETLSEENADSDTDQSSAGSDSDGDTLTGSDNQDSFESAAGLNSDGSESDSSCLSVEDEVGGKKLFHFRHNRDVKKNSVDLKEPEIEEPEPLLQIKATEWWYCDLPAYSTSFFSLHNVKEQTVAGHLAVCKCSTLGMPAERYDDTLQYTENGIHNLLEHGFEWKKMGEWNDSKWTRNDDDETLVDPQICIESAIHPQKKMSAFSGGPLMCEDFCGQRMYCDFLGSLSELSCREAGNLQVAKQVCEDKFFLMAYSTLNEKTHLKQGNEKVR